MNSTRPASSARRRWSRRAAPASMATWESCPQACIAPSTSEAKSSPVSSRSGSASMSARSRSVGPGRPPSSAATTEVVRSPVRTRRPRPSRESRTAAWVRGRVRPISGWRCRRRRRRTASSSRLRASSSSSVGFMGLPRRVGLGRRSGLYGRPGGRSRRRAGRFGVAGGRLAGLGARDGLEREQEAELHPAVHLPEAVGRLPRDEDPGEPEGERLVIAARRGIAQAAGRRAAPEGGGDHQAREGGEADEPAVVQDERGPVRDPAALAHELLVARAEALLEPVAGARAAPEPGAPPERREAGLELDHAPLHRRVLPADERERGLAVDAPEAQVAPGHRDLRHQDGEQGEAGGGGDEDRLAAGRGDAPDPDDDQDDRDDPRDAREGAHEPRDEGADERRLGPGPAPLAPPSP